MKAYAPVKRKFLFLQGPPGPFFWLLGQELEKRGHPVHRINLNGGDRLDWPGKAANYRGRPSRWPRYFDAYVRKHGITDILLFGDCRPMHLTAHGMAKLRNINIHVFEEGYIRPHWMTMEPDGVNGHSTLSRDPEWFLREAEALPPPNEPEPITASFNRRVRDSLRYYLAVWFNRWQFPFNRPHRPGSLALEGIGWIVKFARERWRRKEAEAKLERIAREPYFLFPLQLGSDYQIRTHSPFNTMRDAAIYVMESFAAYAPADTSLVIKEHPLDCEIRSWRSFLHHQAAQLGIGDRVIHIAGGDLTELSENSRGMVTVNSTSGTLGLAAGVPVFVMGTAIYDVPGITHQGVLDEYWRAPQKPVPAIYEAFRKVLENRCLVVGGIASESATRTLIDSTLSRLFEDPAHLPPQEQLERTLDAQAAAAVVGASPVTSVVTGS
ncbi:capsule biosynthesis protein [Sphingobium subterraneum]|uniref:Capsular polysaccharide export protein n=1 Tax=Sphingobium subterraneum TaxID=627688 RepID=A0A841IV64_9SPHN|nr:capsular biosynthesis protein [Sphingobium subterraneum]MBB6122809.1 capsular polysaccharide export protein [Sphingobium subterraneum]